MIAVDRYLAELGEPPAARDADFATLARLTALRKGADGSYYVSNARRGQLLYALLRHLRPRLVLEIGTGRGYGSLCMAMAAIDAGTDTTIVTVDRVPPEARQDWVIDEGKGPTMLRRSLREVWSNLPSDWTDRIVTRTGSSTDVMREWLSEPARQAVDFAFIDGGHDFWTTRHDIMAAVMAGHGGSVSLLLDDYGGVQGEAVRRLVDRRLSPRLPGTAVHRLVMPQTPEEFADNGEHGMVFIDGRAAPVTAEQFGWRRPVVAASVARMAAGMESVLWRTRAGAVRRLRALGVRR